MSLNLYTLLMRADFTKIRNTLWLILLFLQFVIGVTRISILLCYPMPLFPLTTLSLAQSDSDSSNNRKLQSDSSSESDSIPNRDYVFVQYPKLTWQSAREYCQDKYSTPDSSRVGSKISDLAVLDTKQKNDIAWAQISANVDLGDERTAWIGLTDSVEEGKWIYVDGTVGYDYNTFWRPGQPNSHTRGKDQDCAHFGHEGYADGLWNDLQCDNIDGFVCEIRTVTAADVNSVFGKFERVKEDDDQQDKESSGQSGSETVSNNTVTGTSISNDKSSIDSAGDLYFILRNHGFNGATSNAIHSNIWSVGQSRCQTAGGDLAVIRGQQQMEHAMKVIDLSFHSTTVASKSKKYSHSVNSGNSSDANSSNSSSNTISNSSSSPSSSSSHSNVQDSGNHEHLVVWIGLYRSGPEYKNVIQGSADSMLYRWKWVSGLPIPKKGEMSLPWEKVDGKIKEIPENANCVGLAIVHNSESQDSVTSEYHAMPCDHNHAILCGKRKYNHTAAVTVTSQTSESNTEQNHEHWHSDDHHIIPESDLLFGFKYFNTKKTQSEARQYCRSLDNNSDNQYNVTRFTGRKMDLVLIGNSRANTEAYQIACLGSNAATNCDKELGVWIGIEKNIKSDSSNQKSDSYWHYPKIDSESEQRRKTQSQESKGNGKGESDGKKGGKSDSKSSESDSNTAALGSSNSESESSKGSGKSSDGNGKSSDSGKTESEYQELVTFDPSYRNWSSGEPATGIVTGRSLNCASFQFDDSKWVARNCELKLPFICGPADGEAVVEYDENRSYPVPFDPAASNGSTVNDKLDLQITEILNLNLGALNGVGISILVIICLIGIGLCCGIIKLYRKARQGQQGRNSDAIRFMNRRRNTDSSSRLRVNMECEELNASPNDENINVASAYNVPGSDNNSSNSLYQRPRGSVGDNSPQNRGGQGPNSPLSGTGPTNKYDLSYKFNSNTAASSSAGNNPDNSVFTVTGTPLTNNTSTNNNLNFGNFNTTQGTMMNEVEQSGPAQFSLNEASDGPMSTVMGKPANSRGQE